MDYIKCSTDCKPGGKGKRDPQPGEFYFPRRDAGDLCAGCGIGGGSPLLRAFRPGSDRDRPGFGKQDAM